MHRKAIPETNFHLAPMVVLYRSIIAIELLNIVIEFALHSRIEMSYDQDDTLATLKMRALEESDLGIYR